MFFGLLLFALFALIPRGMARTQLCAHQGQCSSHPSYMARTQLAPIQGQCDSYPSYMALPTCASLTKVIFCAAEHDNPL